MSRAICRAFLGLGSLLLPVAAQAGWVIDWNTTAVNARGERMATQPAVQSISGNKVRMQQPDVVTITDYATDRFTLLNPRKQTFWGGPVNDYVSEMSAHRKQVMSDRVAAMGMSEKMKNKAAERGDESHKERVARKEKEALEQAKQLPVSITSTGQHEKIAGYDTEKFEVKVDGELFQELWLATGLNVSADLDAARFLAQQETTGAAMMGKSAKQYNALYHDAQYRSMIERGFVLRNIVHHLAGGYERVATAVKQEDVPASAFEVPESYRRVRLSDLFDPPPTPEPRQISPPSS
ncbi:MAG: DUF4412 domain-containing protein [Deltaproteobacteria bacterium]|nr:DUF4412 domain-containing protein [Deltaproteobacteria bacterium]